MCGFELFYISFIHCQVIPQKSTFIVNIAFIFFIIWLVCCEQNSIMLPWQITPILFMPNDIKA